MLTLDEAARTLVDPKDGRRFDARARAWGPPDGRRRAPGRPLSLREAATWLQRASGHPLRQPVGVIGPREAPEENLAIAEALGRAFGAIGFAWRWRSSAAGSGSDPRAVPCSAHSP